MRLTHRPIIFTLGLGLLLATGLFFVSRPAGAAPALDPALRGAVSSDAGVTPPVSDVPDETCLACHAAPGQTTTLANGDTLYLSIDEAALQASAHGLEGVRCVDCHTGITGFPHPEVAATTARDFTLGLYTTCRQCHEDKYKLTLDSVHQRALAGGDTHAAVCTDCHNPHTQPRLTDKATGEILPEAHSQIPQTCAKCHSAIYEMYGESVHGAALLEGGNPDVPACIDCHGVHNIPDPTTASFRLKSPEMCAKCHTDNARMAKYGLSTDVLNTYVADFHGTTVTLFQKQSPDQQTNKPVCFDCHGFHDVRRVDDPNAGLHIRENLLTACQKCHPDATSQFPEAWLSHYIPSQEHNPLVYYVELFYKFFIPSVIGGMAIFVASDFGRRLVARRKGAGNR